MNASRILSDPRLARLFARTFAHPVLGGRIDLVSTEWLLEIAHPTPSPTTDLGRWGVDDQVDAETLLAHMYREGMRDPVLIGVGRVSRFVRLEAGNHRIPGLLADGILFAPATAYIGDTAVHQAGNGPHIGKRVALWLPEQADIMGPYPENTYARPSDVIPGCPALRFDGWSPEDATVEAR